MWIAIVGEEEVPALVWVMEGAGDAMWLMRWEAVRGGWWGVRGKSPGRSRGGRSCDAAVGAEAGNWGLLSIFALCCRTEFIFQ